MAPPPPPPPPLPPRRVQLGQLVGDYRLGRLIGEGGIGAVYEANHQQTGQRTAVRVLLPTISRNQQVAGRFPFEARAVSLVHNEGLVDISEFGILPDATAFLVMELVEGETLAARLLRQGSRLGEPAALSMGRYLARALSAAHAENLAHGNLKPHNVMLASDPARGGAERPKIMDLGLVRLATGGGDSSQLQLRLGAPSYMAPELCAGNPGADQRAADVYALGVMLYELIGGQLPYPGQTAADVRAAQGRGEPAHIQELDPMVSDDTAAMVHRMLQASPEWRPPMAEVAAELEKLDDRKATQMMPTVPSGPPSRPAAPGKGTMAWAQVVLQKRREAKEGKDDGRRQAATGTPLVRRVLLAVMGVSTLISLVGGVAYVIRKPHRDAAQQPAPAKAPPAPPAKAPPAPPAAETKPAAPETKPETKPAAPETKPAVAEEPEDEPSGKKGRSKKKKEKKEKKKKEKKPRHKKR